MFRILRPLKYYSNDNSRKNAENFLKKGIATVSSQNHSIIKLKKLRTHLELFFKEHSFTRDLNQELDEYPQITQEIQEILLNKGLKNFLKELEIITGEKCYIFPPMQVMRNYFSSPWNNLHGWHCDGDGERSFQYCRDLMDKRYVFGKLQIALQNQTNVGGNIDVIPTSHSDINKHRHRFRTTFRMKLFKKISGLLAILSTKFKMIRIIETLLNQYLCDIASSIGGARTISSPALDILAFDHFLFHRGTPISPKKMDEFAQAFKDGKSLVNESVLRPEVNLCSKNKYMIYLHFGTASGLKSFLYERTRRPKEEWWDNRRLIWEKQFKSSFFVNNYPEISALFNETLSTVKPKYLE